MEAALRAHESVRECAVVATDDDRGRPRLVAHVVPPPDPPELWPSLGEYDVYDELLYYAMTHDERRNAAYREAIGRAVAGKVVLDLGTGADAVLARLCVDAGAQRVYAIEANDERLSPSDRARRDARPARQDRRRPRRLDARRAARARRCLRLGDHRQRRVVRRV